MSVERSVTIARTVVNVVRTKYVVTTNARIRVFGALGLLQALLSVQLSSSPSSFPSYPASTVLVARTTAIVHPVLWSSPNSLINPSSQLIPIWRWRSKYRLLRRSTTTSLLHLTQATLHLQLSIPLLKDKLKPERCLLFSALPNRWSTNPLYETTTCARFFMNALKQETSFL